MSTFRLMSMVVAALVICLSVLVPVSVVGQTSDPTTACNGPSGDPSYGSWVSDTGYSGLWGLESYYSSDYAVLCAWRGFYQYPPTGGADWGPWHGDNSDSNCDITGKQFFSNIDYPTLGIGNFATRTNAADGKRVITSFRIGTTCETNTICAGNCPFFSANYTNLHATLEADPTYQLANFTFGSGGSISGPDDVYVITNMNSTQLTTDVKDPGNFYPSARVSVVTSLQMCYGLVGNACEQK